jgi:hypothetical protein
VPLRAQVTLLSSAKSTEQWTGLPLWASVALQKKWASQLTNAWRIWNLSNYGFHCWRGRRGIAPVCKILRIHWPQRGSQSPWFRLSFATAKRICSPRPTCGATWAQHCTSISAADLCLAAPGFHSSDSRSQLVLASWWWQSSSPCPCWLVNPVLLPKASSATGTDSSPSKGLRQRSLKKLSCTLGTVWDKTKNAQVHVSPTLWTWAMHKSSALPSMRTDVASLLCAEALKGFCTAPALHRSSHLFNLFVLPVSTLKTL